MSWKNHLAEWLRPFDLLWDRLKRHLKSRTAPDKQAPIQVMAYRGYASAYQTWIKGRVLEDRLIIVRTGDSAWRNFINTYKRFSSREIWGAEIAIQLADQTFVLQTDREGYFELLTDTPKILLASRQPWHTPYINLICTPWAQINQQSKGEILFPNQAKFGIISDIDDTIIRTGVTSRLMWRAIYRTILKNAGSRVTFKAVRAFFQALSGYSTRSTHFNPVFYVSNSPWNLYDLIDDFLHLNHLPRGPILLRDLGIPAEPQADGYKGHKYENIAQILQTYPKLPFVLIGDSGEHDVDVYLEITQYFKGRIKAIYIRDVQHEGRTKRVRNLIQNSGRTEVKLLNHFGEAVPHAAKLGLLDPKVYTKWMKEG